MGKASPCEGVLIVSDIVCVQFKSRYRDEYGGPAYTYLADVPLRVGDIVNVPTKYGDSEARVSRVGVPESEVQYHGELRHITKPPAVSGGLFDEFLK